MFYLVKLEEYVRVDPFKFNIPLKNAILETLRERYVGVFDKELGYIVTVLDAPEIDEEGFLIPGDGGVRVRVVADLITYIPYPGDISEGIVEEVTEAGAKIRVGPMSGVLHISQVFDGDYAVYDPKRGALIGKNTQKVLQINDIVRVRITSISTRNEARESRLMLTCRQPGLGKIEWIRRSSEIKQQQA